MKAILARRVKATELPKVIDTIKQRTGLIRGPSMWHHAARRDLQFLLYRHLPRTRRQHRPHPRRQIHVLLPAVSQVGSSIDNVQWESILRSVSAHRSYGWVYDADYKVANIADFLILNRRMPRSLAYCYDEIVNHLGYLARDYGERHAAHETAEKTLPRCAITRSRM